MPPDLINMNTLSRRSMGIRKNLPPVIEVLEWEPYLTPLEEDILHVFIDSHQGDVVGGQYEGEGKITFKNGNEYEGSLFNNYMHGRGTFRWSSSGIVYKGEFSNNQISGEGLYIWEDGSHYTGEVKRGLRHGQGTFTSADNSVCYQGCWYEGKRHGQGTLYFRWPDTVNSLYEGEWRNNLKEGHGRIVYASGNTYEGHWMDDVKNGKGRMTWRHENEIYVGDWQDGLPCGHGSYFWLKSTDFYRDDPESIVTLATRNWYKGGWFRGLRHGRGVFHYSDGSKYEGEWENDKKHGEGVFTDSDGRRFQASQPAPILNLPLGDDEAKIKSTVIRCQTRLKDIYMLYTNLSRYCTGQGEDPCFLLSTFQLYMFLDDIRLTEVNHNLSQILNKCVYPDKGETHKSGRYKFHEFMDILVSMSMAVFPQQTPSQAVSDLLIENILKLAGPDSWSKRRVELMSSRRELFKLKNQSREIEGETDVRPTTASTVSQDRMSDDSEEDDEPKRYSVNPLEDENLPLDLAQPDVWKYIMSIEEELFSIYSSGGKMTAKRFLIALKTNSVIDSTFSIPLVTNLFHESDGSYNVLKELTFFDYVQTLCNCALMKIRQADRDVVFRLEIFFNSFVLKKK
ncbi:hypothetical protein PROFUN_07341 [Planoprotostelium fungivorum]|uniref:Uncharacterized protein n=1 Tax=Planoprotostelium fungivorum TaxID=1890364 RepID=A0A2P6NLV8_9EUKA|nr:hypothetical protein PROFUN_07341 [Planoprotostelium fungivorum]